ncbi:MAG TPA: hypothetical protein DEH78_06950 [Solibacterales bacterium]|nr:hypothetical protein [Bryobacterales bacterium]
MMTRTAFLKTSLAAAAPGAAAGRPAAYLSSKDRRWRLAPVTAAAMGTPGLTLHIDPSIGYQEILGFGGTYTEATAYNLKRLSAPLRRNVLQLFFDPVRGAGWSLLRTTINSCDASSGYYDYTKGSANPEEFNIQPDIDNFMLPGLQEALKISGAQFKIFASPWTPPVGMKDTGLFNKGSLLPQHYAAWAQYMVRYLDAYRAGGVPVWGLTPQNEPEAYEQKWDACGWTAQGMTEFLANHLIPRLRQSHPNVRLLLWDHNKNHMLKWLETMLANGTVRGAAQGIAHHWYEDGEAKNFGPLAEAQKLAPHLPLLATEQGVFGVKLLDGDVAELYARDLLLNMQHGSAAWVVWGMAFDHQGGPNHAGNFNHSPIMIDVEKGRLYLNPSYYYLAHFSRFVRPGARRIRLSGAPETLPAAAFLQANGDVVTTVLNPGGEQVHTAIHAPARRAMVQLPPGSIATVVFPAQAS